MAHGTERWRTAVREVGLALVTAGVVVLLFVAYELVGTNFTEQHNQSRLAKEFTHTVAGAVTTTRPTSTVVTTVPTTKATTPPTGGGGPATTSTTTRPARKGQATTTAPGAQALPFVPPGGALDHLQVPAIGVDRYVVKGVDEADLQMGPGHYPGTPLPGQRGNVGIAGHRTTFGAPFFELNQLVVGDLVYLTDTDGNTWAYKVQRQWVVAPTDVDVLAPTAGAELTMTTCNPRFEASSRLVVRASLWARFRPGQALPSPLPVHVPAHRAASAPKTVSTLPAGPSRPGPVSSGAVRRRGAVRRQAAVPRLAVTTPRWAPRRRPRRTSWLPGVRRRGRELAYGVFRRWPPGCWCVSSPPGAGAGARWPCWWAGPSFACYRCGFPLPT